MNAGATGGDRGAVPIVHLFWRQLEVIGTTMASDAEFRRALDLMVTAGQRAVVDRTVALADVPEALLALERGEQFGKIVVDPVGGGLIRTDGADVEPARSRPARRS